MTRTFIRLGGDTLERHLDRLEEMGACAPKLHAIPSYPGLVVGGVEIVDRDVKTESTSAREGA